MPKYFRITVMVFLIAVMMFPASAYASSKESTSSQSSFLSSLTSRFTSLFTGSGGKEERSNNSNQNGKHNSGNHNSNNHNSNNSNHNGNNNDWDDWNDRGKGNGGFWGWLGGKDFDDDWWDDLKNDSYDFWERYYCY